MSKSISGHFSGTKGANTFSIKYNSDKTNISNPVVNAERVGSALKNDANHNFPSIIDNYANKGHHSIITGGDGVKRSLYQIEGSLNGKSGIFEWIIEGAKCTHRRFIENGRITGKPNQNPKKKE